MNQQPDLSDLPLVEDELDLLGELVLLAGRDIIELGCGAAQLARDLLARYPDAHVTGLEVDERQHAKNLAAPPVPGLQFVAAGAQEIPFADASFDLVIMLKSLHHVPVPLMPKALQEAARVLRPGGHFYSSEPVYAGPFNDVVKLFNEERVVRDEAQSALDAAVESGAWVQLADRWFETSVTFKNFADFERRMMQATYHDHRIDDALQSQVRAAFEAHADDTGKVRFVRPMHARLLRLA
jgi:SAM-dependent methyltransferase